MAEKHLKEGWTAARTNTDARVREPHAWFYEEKQGLYVVCEISLAPENTPNLVSRSFWIPTRAIREYLKRLDQKEV